LFCVYSTAVVTAALTEIGSTNAFFQFEFEEIEIALWDFVLYGISYCEICIVLWDFGLLLFSLTLSEIA